MSKKVREDIGNKRGVTDNHPFQSEGQTTEKARFCLVVMQTKRTIRTPCSVERREWRPGTVKVVQQRSRRQFGAKLSKDRQTKAMMRNGILC